MKRFFSVIILFFILYFLYLPAGIPGFILIPSVFVQAAPYPTSNVITDIIFDTNTHIQLAPGSDNWPVTWGADHYIYTSWGDGGGFGGTNSDGRVSLGFARISGNPPTISGTNIYGGKNPICPYSLTGKSYGIIDINGVLYAWVSPGSNNTNYTKATLYKSIAGVNTSTEPLGCKWTETNVVFTHQTSMVSSYPIHVFW